MNEQLLDDNIPVESPVDSFDSAVMRLERQMERGSFFTHTALGENCIRLNEVESFAYGLIDVLLAKGVVSSAEISTAVGNVRKEMVGNREASGLGVTLRVDKPEQAHRPDVKVNCAERMHICRAICCKLDFALTQDEIESGDIKWDLGRPYHIRHEAKGFCTHNNQATGGCNVYENRPAICRGYSCANDNRIWKDFEKMELNHEWLSENFAESRPRALRVLMQNIETVSVASGSQGA